MADDKGKWIAGSAMLLLAAAIYFIGTNLVNVGPTCTGWGWANPICWFQFMGNVTVDLIFIILAGWTALFGIMIFSLPSERAVWVIILYVALTFTIINLFVPDPIPFVDELIGMAVTVIAGGKALTGSVPQARIPSF